MIDLIIFEVMLFNWNPFLLLSKPMHMLKRKTLAKLWWHLGSRMPLTVLSWPLKGLNLANHKLWWSWGHQPKLRAKLMGESVLIMAIPNTLETPAWNYIGTLIGGMSCNPGKRRITQQLRKAWLELLWSSPSPSYHSFPWLILLLQSTIEVIVDRFCVAPTLKIMVSGSLTPGPRITWPLTRVTFLIQHNHDEFALLTPIGWHILSQGLDRAHFTISFTLPHASCSIFIKQNDVSNSR